MTTDKTIKSKNQPKQTNVTWVDLSGETPVEKHFINGGWVATSSRGPGGTIDYSRLKNKPTINGVELDGDKLFSDLTDGKLYGGIINTQSTVQPDTSCYYIAEEGGNYSAFGVTVNANERVQIIIHNGTAWDVVSLNMYNYSYAHGKFDKVDDIDSLLTDIVPSSASSSNQLLTERERHFKGWFNSLSELKAAHTATEGDSAYIKDASPATTWSIYVYNATASSDNYWADSGTDADTSNVQTFASGEEVNEVHIVNDLTTGGVDDVLSAEQGKVLGNTVNNLDVKINGLPAINNSVSVENTAGSSVNTAYEVNLPKGRFFTINVDRFDYVSHLQIYFRDSDGNSKQVRLIGAETPHSNFTLSTTQNNRQIEIINGDTAKVAFYVSSDKSLISGTTTITINSDATEGMKQVEVVDNLTSTDDDKALSAKQGKVLKDLIDNIDIPDIDIDEIKSFENSVYLGDRHYKKTINVVQGTAISLQSLFDDVTIQPNEFVYVWIENPSLISSFQLRFRNNTTDKITKNSNSGFISFKNGSDAIIDNVYIYAQGTNVLGTGTLIFNIQVSRDSLSSDVYDSLKKTTIQDASQVRNNIETNKPYYFDDTYANVESYDDDSYLDKIIASIPDGKHFLFETDNHIDYNFTNYKNQKQVLIMDYVRKRLGIRNVINGGDIVGGVNTKYKAAKILSIFTRERLAAFGDGYLYAVGNHDVNYPMVGNQGLSEDVALVSDYETYKRTVGEIEKYGKIVFDEEGIQCYKDRAESIGVSTNEEDMKNLLAWMKMHYYYDDVENKIRYIILESGDGAKSIRTTLNTNVVAAIFSQLQFLTKALKSTPDNYDVVIVQHEVYFTWQEDGFITETVSYLNTYYSILSAFKNKDTTSYTAFNANVGQKQQNFANALNNIDANGIQCDFTDSKASGRLFIICGHEHYDNAWIITDNNGTWGGGDYELDLQTDNSSLLIITTDRACITNSSRSTYWANSSSKHPNIASYFASDGSTDPNGTNRIGTTNECLFDVVTITDDNKVVCTRIGAAGTHVNGNQPIYVREYQLP